MINSRAKGKRGELKAAHYLRSLGFEDARRSVQYNGKGRGDVVCPSSLPRLHCEVKYGVGGLDLGTSLLANAIEQAKRDVSLGMNWCVLWLPKGAKQWRLTVPLGPQSSIATFADDDSIVHRLQVIGC